MWRELRIFLYLCTQQNLQNISYTIRLGDRIGKKTKNNYEKEYRNENFFFSIIATSFIAVSCSNDNTADINGVNNIESAKGYAPVNVHVLDFTKYVEDIPATRATQAAADYGDLKTMTLTFFDATADTVVYEHTQYRADASTYTTFGEFSCSLPMGSYKMVVIGHGGTTAITLSSPTSAEFTTDKARETFAYTETVNITTTAAVDVSATLSRICSKLRLASTDGLPANVKKVRVTFSGGGKAFNPATGLATINTGLINEVIMSSPVGARANVNSYIFLATDEQTVDVTIDVLGAEDALLFHKIVTGVPLKRNRMTTLQGKIFSTSSGGGFTLSTDWLDTNIIDF